MKTCIRHMALFAILGAAGCGTAYFETTIGVPSETAEWQTEFDIPRRTLVAEGRNPYFILEPGFVPKQ